MTLEPVTIPRAEGALPGLLLTPDAPQALLVLAHGAGAGMEHRFMEAIAGALGRRGIATLRFQFPYSAAGKKRPDPEPVLRGAVTAAVAEGAARAVAMARGPDPLPLLVGGKSMGGRMASRAAAAGDLDELPVAGIVFLGFPLHPAGRPGTSRGDHLATTRLPLLFLQGDRDALADLDLLRPVLEALGPRATLHVEEGADHGFHVLKRSGRSDPEVVESLADRIVAWEGGGLMEPHSGP